MTSTDDSLLRDLCNLEIPNTIKFSPDGQQVLYSTALTWGHYNGKHAVSTLWLASTGQRGSSRRLTDGSFKDYSPSWAPDGRSIAFISDRAKAGAQWAIYGMIFVAGSPGEVYPITPIEKEKVISAYEFSPDGNFIAYLSVDEETTQQKTRKANGEDMNVWGDQLSYARLRVVALESKQIRSLDLKRHVTGFCWSPDGQQIAINSHRTPDTEEPYLTGSLISLVDSHLLTSTDIVTFPNSFWGLQWDTSERLCFCGPLPATRFSVGTCVYSVDLQSETPTFERMAFGVENDAAELVRSKGTLFAKVEHRMESRICLLDERVLYSEKEELEVFDATFAPDSKEVVLAFASSNVNKPIEVHTKSANGVVVQLSNHGSRFEHQGFGTCTFLTCQSTDGEVELDSCYLSPASHGTGEAISPPSKPLPTIVLIHGGPATRLTNAFNSYYYMLAPYLLSKGYGILLPNYRGSSGRGERFASYTVGGTGQYDYADVIACTQDAIQQGYADKQRLFAAGWSSGGLLTLLCSVRNGLHGFGWKFNACSPGAAVSDLDTMTMTSDIGGSVQAEFNYGCTPWNTDSRAVRNHSGSALREFSGAVKLSREIGRTVVPPMLILHGEEDVRVPVSQAWGVRRACESEGVVFELVTYPRQGHFFGEQKFWIDMAGRIGRWCEKYIGPGIAP